MVHSKSTYKLTYKNISENVRKRIWVENALLREKHRNEEISHHSINESDYKCECDQEAIAEDYDGRSCSRMTQTSKTKRRNSDDEDYDYSDGITNTQKKSEENSCSLKHPSATGRIVRDNKEPQQDLTITRDSLIKGRKSISETDLKNLSKNSFSSKQNRGVLKFIPSTGELDLIPARLGSVKRESDISEIAYSRKVQNGSKGYRGHDDVVTHRPRSAIHFARSPSPRNRRPIIRSGSPLIKSKLELTSSRKEPRTKGRRHTFSDVVCPRCGQRFRQRGVMA